MGPIISVTEKAAQKAKTLLDKKGIPQGSIRVHVTPGGCSGMNYNIAPTDSPPQEGDQVVESHGLKVYLDPKSLLFLAGMTLDYESSLLSQKFTFKNPNAKATCSCGESFSV